jgi:hypothetical protein
MGLRQSDVTATVAINASLSGAVFLGGGSLLVIQMPAAWTAAAITFQSSIDGATYGDVYDSDGIEVAIASATAAASRVIAFTTQMLAVFARLQYLKLRSGTSGAPVTQAAARSLALGTMPV